MIQRRALVPLLLAPAAVRAQPRTEAARPIRLVLPFPAGGATDLVARPFAPGLGERLGQPVVIDNRPGAGGVPAAEIVARAAPDGLTLLLATSSIHSAGPAFNPNLPYDVVADFTPLALLAVAPLLMLVSATIPVTDAAGFIAWAKARPGTVNYGSSGIGTTPHLTGALFNALAGTGMTHVPYRGTGAVYTELRRGDVHVLFDNASTAAPHLASGAVRALAQCGRGETPLAPGLPPLEPILPGMLSETWFGLFAPGRMAPELAARIGAAARAAITEPALRERLAASGAEARGEDGATLGRMAEEERVRWTALVRDLGIRAAE
jgi:tripartite-type tricarboxylate transporter receptor subunit TctC